MPPLPEMTGRGDGGIASPNLRNALRAAASPSSSYCNAAPFIVTLPLPLAIVHVTLIIWPLERA